jgi:hypothetical protein
LELRPPCFLPLGTHIVWFATQAMAIVPAEELPLFDWEHHKLALWMPFALVHRAPVTASWRMPCQRHHAGLPQTTAQKQCCCALELDSLRNAGWPRQAQGLPQHKLTIE